MAKSSTCRRPKIFKTLLIRLPVADIFEHRKWCMRDHIEALSINFLEEQNLCFATINFHWIAPRFSPCYRRSETLPKHPPEFTVASLLRPWNLCENFTHISNQQAENVCQDVIRLPTMWFIPLMQLTLCRDIQERQSWLHHSLLQVFDTTRHDAYLEAYCQLFSEILDNWSSTYHSLKEEVVKKEFIEMFPFQRIDGTSVAKPWFSLKHPSKILL